MKTTYIKPVTELVVLGLGNAVLNEIVTGGSLHGKFEDAAEGNSASFDDDDDFGLSPSSLWED